MATAPKNNALVTIIIATTTSALAYTHDKAFLVVLRIKTTRNNYEDISLSLFLSTQNSLARIKRLSITPQHYLTLERRSFPMQVVPGVSLWSWSSLSVLTLQAILVSAAGLPFKRKAI